MYTCHLDFPVNNDHFPVVSNPVTVKNAVRVKRATRARCRNECLVRAGMSNDAATAAAVAVMGNASIIAINAITQIISHDS